MYIQVRPKNIPEEITNKYNLKDMAMENGTVHIEANKGMYGLPQGVSLINKLLEIHISQQERVLPEQVGVRIVEWRPV